MLFFIMLKRVHTKKAQAVFSQYLLTFFLVLGIVGAMTFFIRRALQARIFDGRNGMLRIVRNVYSGPLYYAYEPYYANTMTSTVQDVDNNDQLLPAGVTGLFRKSLDETARSQTLSVQLPPRDVNIIGDHF